MQEKTQQLLLPFRQKILAALSEVISENKYTWVINESALSQYFQPSIADNLALRTAMKLKLPISKDDEEAFRVATGGSAPKAATKK